GLPRNIRPPSAAPNNSPKTFPSLKGSFACCSARLTSEMTTIASPSRTPPRTPASFSTPGTRGLRPDAVAIVPSRRRTAAAQCVGPWTSRPLRSAMPPRRSLAGAPVAAGSVPNIDFVGSATEQLLADVTEEGRRKAEVVDGDALVGGVDERRGLVQAHAALGKEAVGHAVGEGVAERARVGEA